MPAYFKNLFGALSSSFQGIRITYRHLWQARKARKQNDISQGNYFAEKDGIFTVQSPHFEVPVPQNGRYTLHCEIDDCIVCDKCAKVCPVDCIAIEAIKAPEVIGHTSDGTAKRLHAARFDIDMAKCCFCGLCTTVCPTDCLTMTNEYDYSTYNKEGFLFQYAEMSVVDMAKHKEILANAQQAKKPVTASSSETPAAPGPAKPFKPFKPKPSTPPAEA